MAADLSVATGLLVAAAHLFALLWWGQSFGAYRPTVSRDTILCADPGGADHLGAYQPTVWADYFGTCRLQGQRKPVHSASPGARFRQGWLALTVWDDQPEPT